MSDPAAPFKVILHSVDDMWNSRVRSEVARLFQIDDETASNIVSAIPIVVLDGLGAREAGIVRERLRPLVDGGCRVVTTDDPADTIPRVNWPETPEVARVPADDRTQPQVIVQAADMGPPLAAFSCPGCGQTYQLLRASPNAVAQAAAAAQKGGAPASPGTSAPSTTSQPGLASPPPPKAQEIPPPAPSRSEARPAPAAARASASPADEPGAKLAGDEWLDPPLSTERARSAPPPPPAPTPSAGSLLLEDPLLAVTPSGGTGINDPQTLRSKPITSRFAKGAAARTPGTDRGPAAPVREQPESPPSDRFTLPPPPAPPRTVGLEEDLELQFDDASDLAAAERLPKEPRDDAKAPAGVEGDSGEYKLEGRGAYRDAPAAPPPARAPEPRAQEKAPERDTEAKRSPEPKLAPRQPTEKLDPSEIEEFDLPEPAEKTQAGAGSNDLDLDIGSSDVAALAQSGDVEDILDGPTSAPTVAQPSPRKAPEPEPDLMDLVPLEESGERPPKKAPVAEEKPVSEVDDDAFLEDEAAPAVKAPAAKAAPAAKPAAAKGSQDELLESDSDPLPPPPSAAMKRPVDPAKGKDKGKGKPGIPDESDFEAALALFDESDESPLEPQAAVAKPEPTRAKKDDLEIAPLDLASELAKAPAKGDKKGNSESPFEVRPASAILEPLDPKQAKAILKKQPEEESEDVPEPSGTLEPLDPNEALAILGPDEKGKAGKGAKKPQKHKDPRASSKILPPSGSDEDFDFLDDKAKAKKAQEGAGKPARAAEEAGAKAEKAPDAARVGKKTADKMAIPDTTAVKKPSPRAEAPAGDSPDGDGDHGLVLSRITTPTRRQRAAEIIAEIRGISLDEASRLCDRTIIPVLKGVSKEMAEKHLETFKQNKISGRVTTRQQRQP